MLKHDLSHLGTVKAELLSVLMLKHDLPHLGTVKGELLSVLMLKHNLPHLDIFSVSSWPLYGLFFFFFFYLPFRDVFFYCCPLFEAFEMSKFLMMFLSVIFICYHKQFETQYDIFIEIMLWLTMFWILFVSVVIYYFVFVFVHIFCVHVTDLAHLLCD